MRRIGQMGSAGSQRLRHPSLSLFSKNHRKQPRDEFHQAEEEPAYDDDSDEIEAIGVAEEPALVGDERLRHVVDLKSQRASCRVISHARAKATMTNATARSTSTRELSIEAGGCYFPGLAPFTSVSME